ncbi:MAG: hypothetical protein Ct9H300mP1_24220 [Planctomycetaceae bacterium]|nr:MAG: hypothetical protein Ct9H300mP1_24220 [Planctomycetaceae bacterium]
MGAFSPKGGECMCSSPKGRNPLVPIQQNAVLPKGGRSIPSISPSGIRGWKISGLWEMDQGGATGHSRVSSHDLIHWQQAADLTFGDSPKEELYENRVFPYPRAPHILLGLPNPGISNVAGPHR